MEFSLARNWWVLVVRGVIALAFGVLTFFWPLLPLVLVVASFATFALVDGVFAIVAAVSGQGQGRRWWSLLLEGLLGISAGVLAIVWPEVSLLVLIYFIAYWAVATGVFEIIAAYRLREVIEGEWLLALSGILSVVFGLALVFLPGPGSMAIGLLVGSYSIVFGVLLLVLGIRLRKYARHTPRTGTIPMP